MTTSTESPFIIYRYGYVTITLDEIADSLPKKQAFEMAHYRNLGKLDGSLWAYDEIYRENSLFGLDATIQFQKNMKPLKFLIQIPKYWISNRVSEKFFNDSIFPFDLIPSFIYVIKQEKEFASDALFNNNFDEVLKYEGEYLKNESNKWNEYYNLYLEFVNNLKNFGLVKTIINSTPILLKMNNILDEIISIQELILENN